MASLYLAVTICLLAWTALAKGQSCSMQTDVHSYCGSNLCPPENRLIGNSDDTCRTNFRYENDHKFLPEEWELLFDSWDYENLVGPNRVFLSQEFEDPDDGIDSVGDDDTMFYQRGGSCQYSLRACSHTYGSQNNWLFSDHIRFPAGSTTLGGGHTTEVFFNVSFSFAQCTGACSNDFVTLYRFDTDSIASEADRTNPDNYQSTPLFGQGTETNASRLQQVPGPSTVRGTDSFIPSNSRGFHLGIRDEGTCGQINRFIFYYIPCKESQEGLVYYPELVRPPEGSSTNEAQACCAPNSHNTTSLSFRAFTVSDGTCERNVVCECDAGYRLDGTGMGCEACEAGTYRFESDHETCLACPQNTKLDAVNASICECVDNYFRVAGDQPEGPEADCTTSPGPSGTPTCSASTGTTITVQWSAPTDTGGRPAGDICYIVEYQAITSTDGFINSECVYETMYTIPGLEPITEYRINVVSENSVSDQDLRPGFRATRARNTLCETGEGLPETPTTVQVTANRVLVWQPPLKPNGNITGYQITINTAQGGTKTIDLPATTFYEFTDRDVTANVTTTVRVRAMTSAGFGESSSPITFEPFAPAIVVVVEEGGCALEDMALYIGLTALIAVVATTAIFLIICCTYCVCRKYCCKADKESYDIAKDGYPNSVGLTEKVNWS